MHTLPNRPHSLPNPHHMQVAVTSPPGQLVTGTFAVPETGTPASIVTLDALAPLAPTDSCASTAHIIDTVLLPKELAGVAALA